MFGSGIPNPNLTDETGIRIAEAIENLGGGTPGAGMLVVEFSANLDDMYSEDESLVAANVLVNGEAFAGDREDLFDVIDAANPEAVCMYLKNSGDYLEILKPVCYSRDYPGHPAAFFVTFAAGRQLPLRAFYNTDEDEWAIGTLVS